jgi:orotidine-5'-phosphate decarboxylase
MEGEMKFADRLQASIEKNSSCLCAGFDPRLDTFPLCILKDAEKQKTTEDSIYQALTDFHALALSACADRIACVKPNIAFFECLGLAGLRALQSIIAMIKEYKLPVILDGKRGDIGSTATAYSSAFLGKSTAFGKEIEFLNADALTINPFLGFDTLQPFLDDCCQYDKGLFVLVKTSNPGSSAIQDLTCSGTTVSEKIAEWLNSKGEDLMGSCGYSGLGAVVGATYPEQAKALRSKMPDNFFLIPGLSTQGAGAADACAGFSTKTPRGAAITNVSRGLLGKFSPDISREDLKIEIQNRADNLNRSLKEALQG